MKEKYFYTVLFLDDYYPERDKSSTVPETQVLQLPQMKKFQIMSGTCTQNVKWLSETTLYVRHNLQMPLTMQLWDHNGNTIFYCPILNYGTDSISIGDVIINPDRTQRSFQLQFSDIVPPPSGYNTYVLSVKTLPSFDTRRNRLASSVYNVNKSLDQLIEQTQTGLAIVFRRRTLDQLFDLICQFDESYWHSMAQGTDLKYLTRKSKYQTCKFSTKYTSQLQDVLDLIDTGIYETKFSWDERNS